MTKSRGKHRIPVFGLALVVAAPLAWAQPAPADTELEKVVITGSNIKRSESESAENVQVITHEDIQRSGQPTVADFLRTVSSSYAAFNETFTNSFAPGAAGIALRGLSQKNTLVLLNGRRMTNYGFAQNLEDTFVDLNVIPTSAVDRIEILKSGANAIYGSDATAGVVNIILKEKTTERAVEAGGSVTTDGGGATRDANLSMGFGNFATDNYNVFVTGSVYKRDELLASQRSYLAGQNFNNQPGGYLNWLSAADYTNDAASPNPTITSAFPTCGKVGFPGTVLSTSQLPTSAVGTSCTYNPASQLSVIPGSERANLVTTANFKLSPNWTAFGDIFYSNVKTTSTATPASLSQSAIAFSPASGVTSVSNTLPVGNPSNPNGTPQDINYIFQSVGGQNYEVISNTYRVSGGVKGTWQGLDWDSAYGHSENHVSQTTFNGINAYTLASEIANGSFNFLNPSLTPAANNALRVDFGNTSKTTLDTLGLKTTGTAFNVWSGPVSFAAGVEIRHESMKNLPDAAEASGAVLNFGEVQVDGSRSVGAIFGELDVPIVKTLELDLAAREEHYTDVGSNFSPMATIRWQPVSGFTLRGVGSRGFRAPSLPEVAPASSVSFEQVTDPNDPTHRPSEFIGVLTSGNPHLKPETSGNLDIGLVMSPLNNVNLSIDYYSISVNHVIATGGTASDIIANPAQHPGQIFYTGSGAISYVTVPYTNLYQIATRGYDVAGDVTFPLPDAAKLKLALDAVYVQEMAVNDGTGWTDYAGTNGWLYFSPISGGGPVPRWRGSVTGTWENPNWVAQATLHYTDAYANIASAAFTGIPGTFVTGSNATTDLYAEYHGLKNWTFSGSVVNVFNREPPWDWASWAFSAGAQTFDNTLYDARGRFIEARVKYAF